MASSGVAYPGPFAEWQHAPPAQFATASTEASPVILRPRPCSRIDRAPNTVPADKHARTGQPSSTSSSTGERGGDGGAICAGAHSLTGSDSESVGGGGRPVHLRSAVLVRMVGRERGPVIAPRVTASLALRLSLLAWIPRHVRWFGVVDQHRSISPTNPTSAAFPLSWHGVSQSIAKLGVLPSG
jgi:hypothetical protein